MVGRLIRAVKETWDELDYAQRRLLEIQMGRDGLARARARPRIARSVEELESLFAYEGPATDTGGASV